MTIRPDWAISGATILEQLPAAVVGLDLAANVTSWNSGAADLFGYKADEVVGKSIFNVLVAAEDAEAAEGIHVQLVDGDGWSGDFPIVRADGSLAVTALQMCACRNEFGEVVGLVLVAMDLTERAEAERQKGDLLLRERDARRRAEQQEQRLAVLADATTMLTGTLEPTRMIELLANRLVPDIADMCTIELLDADGNSSDIAVAHVDAAEAAVIKAQREAHPFTASEINPIALSAIQAGRPLLFDGENSRTVMVDSVSDEGSREAYSTLKLHSFLTAPMQARGRTLGILSIADGPGRNLNQEDVQLIGDLTQRAAMSLDNARLYQLEHRVASSLQRALLPQTLPTVPGLALASRYFPSTEGFDIGGDWYDVLVRPDGNVVLIVGDVVGHDERAASVMGAFRNAARAYAIEANRPAEILTRLDQFVSATTEDMATCVVVLLDPKTGEGRYAIAGHPPPLLVNCDGGASFLPGLSEPLIGLGYSFGYREQPLELRHNDTILMYTDGLIERRDRSLQDGFNTLREVATTLDRNPEALCDGLSGQLFPAETGNIDDIALLVATRLS